MDECLQGVEQIEKSMETQRLATLLTGEYDSKNAILTFHAGAGGTEAQDWASMLYRMYTHWADTHGYQYNILDYLDGDEAGLKSASIEIIGENAYGYLKGEADWCASPPSTPPADGTPPSRRSRSSPRSTMIQRWIFVPRISKWMCSVPPVRAVSISTKPRRRSV